MATCEICGYDHGPEIVHIKRTAPVSRLDKAFQDAYEDEVDELFKERGSYMNNKPFTATELLKQNEEYLRNPPQSYKNVAEAFERHRNRLLEPLISRVAAILKKYSH